MKKLPVLALTALALLLAACKQGPYLAEAAPDEVGLNWQECRVSEETYIDWKQPEACFGHPPPSLSDEDKVRAGMRTSDGHLLRIGDDTYETHAHELVFLQWFTLYKNGRPLNTLSGGTGVYSPDISLWNVKGKVAWEFANSDRATVIYDGEDTRRRYGLQAAYVPYEIGESLIFVGQKDGKYFVVYDGQKVSPEFDQVYIGYCCEPAAYSVRRGQGRYFFRGRRAGEYYLVEIAAQ